MGYVYAARCACGYNEPELDEGTGMLGQTNALALCSDCRRLAACQTRKSFMLEQHNDSLRCPHCAGQELTLIEFEAEAPPCPRCNSHQLTLAVTGCWD